MKKAIIAILAIAMVFAFVSCSKSASSAAPSATTSTPAATTTTAAAPTTTPSTGTVDSEFDPNKSVDFVQQTNDTNRVVTLGTIEKGAFKAPVFVTSFGQSTDAAMLDTLMKKIGVEYVYNATAKATDLQNYKTVVIAVGASTKGLGAAGISEAQETARATEIINFLKANSDVKVICCHIGGSARRGTLSDAYADMVMDLSSLIVLKEDANFDYKFTKYAEEHNVPISLVYATKDTMTVFTEVFN